MSDRKPNQITPPSGFFDEIGVKAKLIWRLMGDRRVNIFLKLIPVGSLFYLINPIDLPTPLDDFGVIGLALYLFVELCPTDIVQEHTNAIRRIASGVWNNPQSPGNVVDAEFREVDETTKSDPKSDHPDSTSG